jgi:hypothetical protein
MKLDAMKFLGLSLDNHPSWKHYVDYLLTKLINLCFMMRKLIHVLSAGTLMLTYFAYFQSVVKYGIIFWGCSANIDKVFLLLKMIIRIMVGMGPRGSCRRGFRKLNILTVPCLYILF